MKIEIKYADLLDIANALRARADVFERLSKHWSKDMGRNPEYWQTEAMKHRAIADNLLAQADAAMKAKDGDDAQD
jgi:hypothetical protein